MKIKFFILLFSINFYSLIFNGVPNPPLLTSASVNCQGQVSVGGTAQANAFITVFSDSINIGNSSANLSGFFNFKITPNPLLSDGRHLIKVTQTVGTQESNPSNGMTVFVTSCKKLRILKPANGTITFDLTPTISGVGPANTKLNVLADVGKFASTNISHTKNISKTIIRGFRSVLGQTNTDSLGRFTFTPPDPLTPGKYEIFVILAENPSIKSNTITMIIEPLFDVLTTAIFNKYKCT